MSDSTTVNMDSENVTEEETNLKNISTSSKESEGENLDAIKKFIEDQEKEIQKDIDSKNQQLQEIEGREANTQNVHDNIEELKEESLTIATSVMDMILSESGSSISKKQDGKPLTKQCLSQRDKGHSSITLSVGSRVEAKDYGEYWHSAEIIEVDSDEMEVLVHYENATKRHDEWISVSSPRLRPISSSSNTPSASVPRAEENDSVNNAANTDSSTKEEPKMDEKPKLQFVVGERCLARWRDNRRFIATIQNDLGNGQYQIMFDDGFQWDCTTSRLYKLKTSTGKNDILSIDTSMTSSTCSTPSPVLYEGGPSTVGPTNPMISQIPIFHTHLFDPTRDYLGSKSERREMKRKLNIKEIFNIGQKKKKKLSNDTSKKNATDKKPNILKRKSNLKTMSKSQIKTEIKKEIPDAVASIIGTVNKDEKVEEEIKSKIKNDETTSIDNIMKSEENDGTTEESPLDNDLNDIKNDDDPVVKEEVKLENFEKQDETKHEEVIDKMKEVINKLEDGINKAERMDSPKPKVKEEDKEEVNEVAKEVVKEEVKTEEIKPAETLATDNSSGDKEKPKKNLSKIKKGRKLRLLQEKKVKKQVEKVKSELEEMKKQVEEMRKQMLIKTEELAKSQPKIETPENAQNQPKMEMPESFLLPGEWCCKWVNGQPVGTVSEMETEVKMDANNKPVLPRRSVQVEDKRLPPGWAKHMVRRSFGNSAGKWDIVLVSPENRRFHTKVEMRNYLDNIVDESLKPYEYALLDFGVHLKLSRRMGWVTDTTGEGVPPVVPLPAGLLSNTSPLVKRKNLSIKKNKVKRIKVKEKKRKMNFSTPVSEELRPDLGAFNANISSSSENKSFLDSSLISTEMSLGSPMLEDGYVYVGSLKVQIIENLLRCPAEGCFKNFRNNTLLQMHIKHYHRELRKMMGATPKVLDLAYARTMPNEAEVRPRETESKIIKVKIPKPPKRVEESKPEPKDTKPELQVDVTPTTPVKTDSDKISRSQDSPKLRHALINKPVKRPRVLLPVRRPELTEPVLEIPQEAINVQQTPSPIPSVVDKPHIEPLDFEMAISTHTVTKPLDKKKIGEKKRKSFATVSKKPVSEDDEWAGINSDLDTMSSFPRSETPDSKTMDGKEYMLPASSESNEEQKDTNMYMYNENGERIKIVHMKREEIINCHCGFREEDGLMVQCELCLCWQHALCHNIQKESEVPEKYTCSICLNPRRGRRSQRFLHDQDRLYEGLLPGAKPCESLRRSHELSGNLLRIEDALHALRVKYYVATKKDHPKLYLWAKDWENGELNFTQEKLNSDYSDLNIIISDIGKENLPIKHEDMKDIPLDMRTPPSEEQDGERFDQREGQLGSQTLLSGLLSSPGGASLDLPISTSELERLAKSVQEQEQRCGIGVQAPQPEAAIENGACRERLLRHIQRCQALIDARLDSIEAQVAELESQDPSFEDDETADYFPRTKQTIQMLLRDLDTMEELGVIT